MSKIILYITAKTIWTFLFWSSDVHENRAHVHVGKKATNVLAKFWLEPTISVANKGSLTDAQIKQILEFITAHKDILLDQWQIFKSGKKVKLITITKK